jgi:hypothetical protein
MPYPIELPRVGQAMTAEWARQRATMWVATCLPEWPGILGAHFVGGITSMPDDAPFPACKDVDLHLIFEEGSPALTQSGPFMNVIEVEYGGVCIEAGIKPASEYRSAEAVLSNPEIAHHLTLDSLIYDPRGLLHALQRQVRAEYPRRKWVLARVEHERNGLAGAMGMRQMVAAQFGALSELSLLGYGATFMTGLLSVASLKSPRIGSGALVHLSMSLAAHDRLDLYDELLEVLGVRQLDRAQVEAWLREAATAFDLAVQVRRSPHPFQHKLRRHLRPYFVESSQAMIDAGCHREAMPWITAYYAGATDVLLADGPEADKPRWLAGRESMLVTLGSETAAARAARFQQAHCLYDKLFALAGSIIDRHPGIVD